MKINLLSCLHTHERVYVEIKSCIIIFKSAIASHITHIIVILSSSFFSPFLNVLKKSKYNGI